MVPNYGQLLLIAPSISMAAGYVIVFLVIFLDSVRGVSDAQYALMPNLFHLDNFDQCLLDGNKSLFCTFTFVLQPPSNSNEIWSIIKNVSGNPQNYRHDHLRHGICLPHTCADDYNVTAPVEQTIDRCYNRKYGRLGLTGRVDNVICQSNLRAYPIDVYDITFGSIVGFYLLFVLFASFYDRYLKADKLRFYEKGHCKVDQIIAAFSLPRNWYRLRSTSSNPDHRKLRSIQGIRFYNMICVIMSHTVMAALGGAVSNPQYTENTTKHVLNMFLANGWYAVQAFFVISGWLLSYHFFETISDTKKFKPTYLILAIINRYIRLAPAVALMVGIHATWLVQLSNGPYWDMFVGQEYRNCRNNWWINLLFVNNYVNNNHMCLHQTWYIAADMQLFVLAVVPLYFIWRYPCKRRLIFGSLLLIGFVTPGIMAYVNQYDIIIRQYPEILYDLNLLKLDHWHKLYTSAYTNIFGYTVGMIFGYLFYTYRGTQLKIRLVHLVLWWLLTFGLCIFVVLIAIIFYDPSFVVTPFRSGIYWSCGKNLFALGVAIGIFGFTQKIGFLADVTCAYLGGTILCLLVEMPVSALQKLTGLNRHRTRAKKSSEKSLETLDMGGNENANNAI